MGVQPVTAVKEEAPKPKKKFIKKKDDLMNIDFNKNVKKEEPLTENWEDMLSDEGEKPEPKVEEKKQEI